MDWKSTWKCWKQSSTDAEKSGTQKRDNSLNRLERLKDKKANIKVVAEAFDDFQRFTKTISYREK